MTRVGFEGSHRWREGSFFGPKFVENFCGAFDSLCYSHALSTGSGLMLPGRG
jgi:hypothetical protein